MTRHLELRAMTRHELDEVSGGNGGVINFLDDVSPTASDSDTYAARTITMFLRRVWRDGALFGRTHAG
jgi:hypothetical protein